MRLGRALIIPVLAVSFAGHVEAAAPPTGSFTNVRYIARADDYVGLNLEVLSGPKPTVKYELCEGWCNGAHIFSAEISDSTIRFTVREDLQNQDGRPAAPLIYRVEARLVQTALGRRLVVTSPDNEEFREVLKPMKRQR